MEDSKDTGLLIKLTGAIGIIMLLSVIVVAFFLHHSSELSIDSDQGERRLAETRR